MRFLALILFLLLPAATANAEIAVETYIESKDASEAVQKVVNDYLMGVGRGIFIAAVYAPKDKKVICPPSKYSPAGAQFIQWIDDAIKETPDEIKELFKYVEVLLFLRMQQIFPCE